VKNNDREGFKQALEGDPALIAIVKTIEEEKTFFS